MRVLLAIVVLAGLGWSGFWFWNASTRDRALTNWLEERRAAGWVADGAVRVTGFPEPGRYHRHRPRPRRSEIRLVLAGTGVPDPVAILEAVSHDRGLAGRADHRLRLRVGPDQQRAPGRLAGLRAEHAAGAGPFHDGNQEHALRRRIRLAGGDRRGAVLDPASRGCRGAVFLRHRLQRAGPDPARRMDRRNRSGRRSAEGHRHHASGRDGRLRPALGPRGDRRR